MQRYLYKILILFLAIYIFNACLGKEEEILFSDDPNFVSLKFDANDSIPGLEKAVFTVEFDEDLQDSIIVNLDSLPFQTRIDSIGPTFTFRSSAYAYLIALDSLETGFDTIAITGKDTVNFEKVVSVTNFAANREVSATYHIKVNVHQVEPELYVWKRAVDAIYEHGGNVQQAVFFKDRFLFYVSTGLTNYLYTSDNAIDWFPMAINGLPLTDNFTTIKSFNDKLYLLHQNGSIYNSEDGENWTATDPGVSGYAARNLLFVLDNKLWALFQQAADGKLYYAFSENGDDWQLTEAASTMFPVVDFASLNFASRVQKPKALILGGRNNAGTLLNKTWSVEKNVNGVYKWVDFTADKTDAQPYAGAAVIPYDNKLLRFGGMNDDDYVIGNGLAESVDEGLTWRATDSLYNTIYDTEREISYQKRAFQSVILDEENHFIYLIGGKGRNDAGVQFYSDVWIGKLNRMYFPEK